MASRPPNRIRDGPLLNAAAATACSTPRSGWPPPLGFADLGDLFALPPAFGVQVRASRGSDGQPNQCAIPVIWVDQRLLAAETYPRAKTLFASAQSDLQVAQPEQSSASHWSAAWHGFWRPATRKTMDSTCGAARVERLDRVEAAFRCTLGQWGWGQTRLTIAARCARWTSVRGPLVAASPAEWTVETFFTLTLQIRRSPITPCSSRAYSRSVTAFQRPGCWQRSRRKDGQREDGQPRQPFLQGSGRNVHPTAWRDGQGI